MLYIYYSYFSFIYLFISVYNCDHSLLITLIFGKVSSNIHFIFISCFDFLSYFFNALAFHFHLMLLFWKLFSPYLIFLVIKRELLHFCSSVHACLIDFMNGIKSPKFWLACTKCTPQSTYSGRDEIGWACVSALSAGAYTETLYVRVTRVKGGGVHSSLHQGWFFHHDGMYARNRQLPICVLCAALSQQNSALAHIFPFFLLRRWFTWTPESNREKYRFRRIFTSQFREWQIYVETLLDCGV